MARFLTAAVGERLLVEGEIVVTRTRGPRVVFSIDDRTSVRRLNRVSSELRRSTRDPDRGLADAARQAYSAYGATLGWRSDQGESLPEWSELSARTRAGWLAAIQVTSPKSKVASQ